MLCIIRESLPSMCEDLGSITISKLHVQSVTQVYRVSEVFQVPGSCELCSWFCPLD